MTAPITKPVLEDRWFCETGGNREKNFLIKTICGTVLFYNSRDKERGDLNMFGIILDNRYIQVLA
jgi:hypothetical protein